MQIHQARPPHLSRHKPDPFALPEKQKADTAGNLTAIPTKRAAARQDVYLSQKQVHAHSQMAWASGGGRGR